MSLHPKSIGYECPPVTGNCGVKYLLFVKKGMARKAFIKNMSNGNLDKLNKQISKGTVKVWTK